MEKLKQEVYGMHGSEKDCEYFEPKDEKEGLNR